MVMSAEYKGDPGPLLVLQLKDALELTEQQYAKAQKLHDELQARALELSTLRIRTERVLDELLAQEQTAPETMAAAVTAVVNAQGQLRDAHLLCRIAVLEMLTPKQLAIYRQIRGY